MAALVWGLCCRTAMHRCMSMAHFVDIPLGSLLLLGSKDSASVNIGLQRAREAWGFMVKVESMQCALQGVQSVMRKVVWLFNPAIRELLTLVAQHGFQFVCPDAMSMVETVLYGFCNTVIIEKAFQKLQDIGRTSKKQ